MLTTSSDSAERFDRSEGSVCIRQNGQTQTEWEKEKLMV